MIFFPLKNKGAVSILLWKAYKIELNWGNILSTNVPSAKNNVCKNLANVQRALAIVGISTKYKARFFPVKNRVSRWECEIECEEFLTPQNTIGRAVRILWVLCQIRGRSSEF